MLDYLIGVGLAVTALATGLGVMAAMKRQPRHRRPITWRQRLARWRPDDEGGE